MQPINIDANPENADWTKRYSWDLGVDDLAGLRFYLIQHDYTVEHFKTLPVFQVNQYLHPWLQEIPDDLLHPQWRPPVAAEPAGSRSSTVTVRGGKKP